MLRTKTRERHHHHGSKSLEREDTSKVGEEFHNANDDNDDDIGDDHAYVEDDAEDNAADYADDAIYQPLRSGRIWHKVNF